MPKSSSGRSAKNGSEAGRSERRRDTDDSTPTKTRSRTDSVTTSSSTRRKSSKRDDDDDDDDDDNNDGGDRGFMPNSTSFASSSRSPYSGVAAPSVASSYATANDSFAPIRPAELVRNESMADSPRNESHRDSKRDSKSEKRSQRRSTTDNYDDDLRNAGRAEKDSRDSRKSSKSDTKDKARAYDAHDASLPQNQFPGQEPVDYAAPYRPGQATSYYNDQGESVGYQPGVRPDGNSIVYSADQAHLMQPSTDAQPPPEPSSVGQVGAAASYFGGGGEDDIAQPTTPSKSSKKTKSKSSRTDNQASSQRISSSAAGRTSSSNAMASSALGGDAIGEAAAYFSGAPMMGSNDPRPYQTASPDSIYSKPGPQSHSYSTQGHSHGYGAAATAGMAAGAAGAYMAGHSQHGSKPYSTGGPDPNFVLGQNQSAFPQMQHQHRQKRRGPFGKLVNWFKDPDGVAQFEQYSEAIGVCKYCFDPHSSPMDAPRKHHYHGRRSSPQRRSAGSSRVDKTYRYSSSDDERRRGSSKKNVLAGGLAGIGAAKIGQALYDQKHGFDDTYSVKTGRLATDRPANRSRVSFQDEDQTYSTSRGVNFSKDDARLERRSSGKKSKRDQESSDKRRSRRRSSSSSSSSNGISKTAALGLGAVGLAAGAAVASRRRSRSRSPSKRKKGYYSKRISPKHSYIDLNDTNTGTFGLGQFFSPSQNDRGGKHSKGFFRFSNESSSSSDADLAFGEGTVRRKNSRKLREDDGRDVFNSKTAAALTATGMALASESDGKGKGKKYANVYSDDRSRRAGESSRIKLHDHETTTDADNDDGWYDTDGEGVPSSDDGGLLYGGRNSAARSKDSLVEEGGWWPWSTPRSKDRRSRFEPETPSRINPATAAALGAGAGAVAAGILSSQRTTPSRSTDYLPAMQEIDPIPASEAMMSGAIAPTRTPSGQYVSTTGSVPIQQPQPIAPIGSVPNAITNNISDERRFPDQDYESRRRRRRDSSPAKFPSRNGQVSFSIPDERPQESRERDREQQRRDKKERRRTYDFSESAKDAERRAAREAEIEAELERLYEEDRSRGSGRTRDKDEKHRSHDGIGIGTVAAAAAVGAGAIAASNLSKQTRESSSERERPLQTRKSSLKRSKNREESPTSETQQERIARMAAQRVRSAPPTVEHDSYGSFFVPKEIAEHVEEHNEASAARNDPDQAHVVEIVPGAKKQEQFDPFHYRVFGTHADDDPLAHPWAVPTLALVDATPPTSRLGSRATSPAVSSAASPVSSPVKDREPISEEDLGEKLERKRSQVTWGDHDTYLYEVMTPEEERSNPIHDSPEDTRTSNAARKVVAAAAVAAAAAAASKSRSGREFTTSKLSRVQTLPDDYEEGQKQNIREVPPVEEMTPEQREHISRGRDFADMPGSFETQQEEIRTSTSGDDSSGRREFAEPQVPGSVRNIDDTNDVPRTGLSRVEDGSLPEALKKDRHSESSREAPPESPDMVEVAPRTSKSERRRMERAASLEDAPQYTPQTPTAEHIDDKSAVFDYLVDEEGKPLPASSALNYGPESIVSNGRGSEREWFRPTNNDHFDKPRRVSTFDNEIKTDKRPSKSRTSYASDPEDWDRSPSRKDNKRSARSDVGLGTTTAVAAGAAAASMAAIAAATADDDFYSKDDKSKRRSKRESEIFNDGGDVGSVISSPATRNDDKKARRRSKRESEIYDDDDTRSVASSPADSSSRKRSKDTADKDEKRSSGIWSSIFGGPKSDVSTSSKKSQKSSKSESRADKGDESQKKKKRRSKGFDIDDAASAASEPIRSSRHERDSTPTATSRGPISQFSSRDQSVEDGFASAHEDISPVKEYSEDQSFLAERPEMPHMRPTDLPMATTDDGVSGLPVTTESKAPSSGEPEATPPTTQARRISTLRTSDLSATVPSGASPTAVPINFRRLPISPATPRAFFSSPIASPQSPLATSKTRQGRPKSTEFRSKEFRPLYLVEKSRSEKTPVPDVEEDLPSLPSSRSSSAHPSLDDLRATAEKQDYFGLADGKTSPRSFQEKGRRHSYSYWHDEPKRRESPDYLDSRAATPVPLGVQKEREAKQREEREARERERAAKPKPKYEFHSPSELLNDPAMLADIAAGEAEGEVRLGSPLPSVISTQEDDFMSAREGTPSDRSRSRSRSKPRSRHDTVTAAGIGLGIGAAAAIGVNELLSHAKDEEKTSNSGVRDFIEQEDMYGESVPQPTEASPEATAGEAEEAAEMPQEQSRELQHEAPAEADERAFQIPGKKSKKEKKKAKSRATPEIAFDQTAPAPVTEEPAVVEDDSTSATPTPAEEIDEWAFPTSKKPKKGKKGKKKDVSAAIDVEKAEAKGEDEKPSVDDEPLTAVPSLPEEPQSGDALSDKIPELLPQVAAVAQALDAQKVEFSQQPASTGDLTGSLSRDGPPTDSSALHYEPTVLEEHGDKDAFAFETAEVVPDAVAPLVQDPTDPGLLELTRTTSYVPPAAEVNKQGNDTTAFKEAFERAVRARGLSQSSSREDALEAFLPTRENAPFVHADALPSVGEESGSGTPRDADKSIAAQPEVVEQEVAVETAPSDALAWTPTSKKDNKKKKKGQAMTPVEEAATDFSRDVAVVDEPTPEEIGNSGGPDTPLANADDEFSWAPLSKKEKKKKRQSKALDLSESADLAEASTAEAVRDDTVPNVEEHEALGNDSWEAPTGKKGKKSKKDKKKSSDWTDDLAPIAGAAAAGAGAALAATAFEDDKRETVAEPEELPEAAMEQTRDVHPTDQPITGTSEPQAPTETEVKADDFFEIPVSGKKKDKKMRKSAAFAWDDESSQRESEPAAEIDATEVEKSIPLATSIDDADASANVMALPSRDQESSAAVANEDAPSAETDAPQDVGEDEWSVPTKMSKKEKRKAKKDKNFDVDTEPASQPAPLSVSTDIPELSKPLPEQQAAEHAEELRIASAQEHHDYPAHQDFLAGAHEKAAEFPPSPYGQEPHHDAHVAETTVDTAGSAADVVQSSAPIDERSLSQVLTAPGEHENRELAEDVISLEPTKKSKKGNRKEQKRRSTVLDERDEQSTPASTGEDVSNEAKEAEVPKHQDDARDLPASEATPSVDQEDKEAPTAALPSDVPAPMPSDAPIEAAEDFSWAPTKKSKKDKKAKRASLALNDESAPSPMRDLEQAPSSGDLDKGTAAVATSLGLASATPTETPAQEADDFSWAPTKKSKKDKKKRKSVTWAEDESSTPQTQDGDEQAVSEPPTAPVTDEAHPPSGIVSSEVLVEEPGQLHPAQDQINARALAEGQAEIEKVGDVEPDVQPASSSEAINAAEEQMVETVQQDPGQSDPPAAADEAEAPSGWFSWATGKSGKKDKKNRGSIFGFGAASEDVTKPEPSEVEPTSEPQPVPGDAPKDVQEDVQPAPFIVPDAAVVAPVEEATVDTPAESQPAAIQDIDSSPGAQAEETDRDITLRTQQSGTQETAVEDEWAVPSKKSKRDKKKKRVSTFDFDEPEVTEPAMSAEPAEPVGTSATSAPEMVEDLDWDLGLSKKERKAREKELKLAGNWPPMKTKELEPSPAEAESLTEVPETRAKSPEPDIIAEDQEKSIDSTMKDTEPATESATTPEMVEDLDWDLGLSSKERKKMRKELELAGNWPPMKLKETNDSVIPHTTAETQEESGTGAEPESEAPRSPAAAVPEMVEDFDWDLGLSKKERKAKEKQLKLAGNWPPMKPKEPDFGDLAEPATEADPDMTETLHGDTSADLSGATEPTTWEPAAKEVDTSREVPEVPEPTQEPAAEDESAFTSKKSKKDKKAKRASAFSALDEPSGTSTPEPELAIETSKEQPPEFAIPVGEATEPQAAPASVGEDIAGKEASLNLPAVAAGTDAIADTLVDSSADPATETPMPTETFVETPAADDEWAFPVTNKKSKKDKKKKRASTLDWDEPTETSTPEPQPQPEKSDVGPAPTPKRDEADATDTFETAPLSATGVPDIDAPIAEDEWAAPVTSKKSKKDKKKRASTFDWDVPSESSTLPPEAEALAGDKAAESVSAAPVVESEPIAGEQPAAEPQGTKHETEPVEVEPTSTQQDVPDEASLDAQEPVAPPAEIVPGAESSSKELAPDSVETRPLDSAVAEDQWSIPLSSKAKKDKKKKKKGLSFDDFAEPSPVDEPSLPTEPAATDPITTSDSFEPSTATREADRATEQEPLTAEGTSAETPADDDFWATPAKTSKKDKKKRDSTLVLENGPESFAEQAEAATDQPQQLEADETSRSVDAEKAAVPLTAEVEASMFMSNEPTSSTQPEADRGPATDSSQPVEAEPHVAAEPDVEMVEDPDWDFGLNSKQRKKKEKELRNSGNWPPMKAVELRSLQQSTPFDESNLTGGPNLEPVDEPIADVGQAVESAPDTSKSFGAKQSAIAEPTFDKVEDPDWDFGLNTKQRKKKEKELRSSGNWPPMKSVERSSEEKPAFTAEPDQPMEPLDVPMTEPVDTNEPTLDHTESVEPTLAATAAPATELVEDPDWDVGLSSKQRKKKEKDLRSSGQWPPMKAIEKVSEPEAEPTSGTPPESIVEPALEAEQPAEAVAEPEPEEWGFSSKKSKKDKKQKRGSAFSWDDEQSTSRDLSGDVTPAQEAESTGLSDTTLAAGVAATATAAVASTNDDPSRQLDPEPHTEPVEAGADDWAIPTKKSSKKDKKKRKSIPGAFGEESGSTSTSATPIEVEPTRGSAPRLQDEKPRHGREHSIDDAFDDVLLMDGLQRDEAVEGPDRWAFENDFMSGEPSRFSEEPEQVDVTMEDQPAVVEQADPDTVIAQPPQPVTESEFETKAPAVAEEPGPEDDWGFSTGKKSKKDKKKKRESTMQDTSADASSVASPARVATPPPDISEPTQDAARSVEPEKLDLEDATTLTEAETSRAKEATPEDDWGYTPSRKSSKKDKKKKRQSTFDDFEPEASRDADVIPQAAAPEPSPAGPPGDTDHRGDKQIENESSRNIDVGAAAVATAAGIGAAALAASTQADQESAAKGDDDFGFTPSRKSSKKDKKKNRQAEFYEPEEDLQHDQAMKDADATPAEVVGDITSGPQADLGSTAERVVEEPKLEDDWYSAPARKPSKKDKKKNRQAEFYEPTEDSIRDEPTQAAFSSADAPRGDLGTPAGPTSATDQPLEEAKADDVRGFEQPKSDKKDKNRQAEFYEPVATPAERTQFDEATSASAEPASAGRHSPFDRTNPEPDPIPQADPDDVWGFTPQRKASKKDKKKKGDIALDEPSFEQDTRPVDDFTAFPAPTPPPAVPEAVTRSEAPVASPRDATADILKDYEEPSPGIARTNTVQEVDDWYSSTAKPKKGKKKGGLQRADTIDTIAMSYGEGGEAQPEASRGVDQPETIPEEQEDYGVSRKKSKKDKKKAKTSIVWEEEPPAEGSHTAQPVADDWDPSPTKGKKNKKEEGNQPESASDYHEPRAMSPAHAWSVAAAAPAEPHDTIMHDSDGSNVSESTRERRRRRGSPRAWAGEEPPDLPRDRAMTPPPEHNDIMDTALGVAATLGFGAGDDKPKETSRSIKEEPSWSFANVRPSRDKLQEVNRDSGVQFDSPTVGTGEHSVRDSGYEHGYEHDQPRDSLRPARPQSPTSSTEDVTRSRNLATSYETPAKQQPDPIESTSKDRSSVVFKSSPATQTPRTPYVDASMPNLQTPTDIHRSPSIHGRRKSREGLSQSDEDRRRSTGSPLASNLIDRASASAVDRTVFSPPSSSHPLSPPRSPLQAIPEHGHTDDLTKAAMVAGVGAAGVVGAAALSRDAGHSLGKSKSRTSSLRNLRGSSNSPFDNPEAGSSRSFDERSSGKAAAPERDMADYDGYGHHPGSPMSPTRPPSITKRRSMQQIQDLQTKIDQLASENRNLAEAKITAERHLEDFHLTQHKSEYATEEALRTAESQLRDRDEEISKLQEEIAGMAALQAERASWQEGTRELETLRSQHQELSKGMDSIIRHEIDAAMLEKNAEIERLQRDLAVAKDKIRELQSQILARGTGGGDDDIVDTKDEDYFDNACQQLCQHVQQWVLRFSKFSDTRVCRTTNEVRDEKIVDRFDNAILDGSDVDIYLADRVKRRDVFMSVVMTMIWEYVFTRYLFGMDREQRQKLKQLEKNLAEVGPASAVNRWRAITLTMLSKRAPFKSQCDNDTEAVALEVFSTLSKFLPPPGNLEAQIVESLRGVMRKAVELSVEMRCQRQEYVMLPPLQPEYDTNGDLARQVYFNASLMNERSGETRDNEELEREGAVVRVVLFPLVVSKTLVTDEGGLEREEEVVVCPAQVLVAREGKRSKSRQSAGGSRSASGKVMSTDARSTHSLGAMSGVEASGNGNMI